MRAWNAVQGWDSAIAAVATATGASPDRVWVRRSERDRGVRAGLTTEERDRLKALDGENRELRHGEEDQETVRWTVSPTNEILRKAGAYFCTGGARAPVQGMIAFIDDHRA